MVFVLVLCCLGLQLACGGDESRAERLYGKAKDHVDAGELQQAADRYQEILDRYGATKAAERARHGLVLVRGLDRAVRTYSARTARQLMVETARAIQSYHARRGAWPESFDRLLQEWIQESPIDPWGRLLRYARKPRGRGYVLACYGADGRPGGQGDDGDFYVEDGEFVGRPSVGLP